MAYGSKRNVTNTTDDSIRVWGLGVTLSGGETRDLVEYYTYDKIARCDHLLELVVSGTLTFDDGISDYGAADSLRLLANLEPQFSFDDSGELKTELAKNPVSYDKKIIVHASPRPLSPKTYTHYMGRGDDLVSSLHGESDVHFGLTCSGSYKEADFKFLSDGKVYVRGAAFGWENCSWGVEISCEMFSDPTPLYIAASGNTYNVDAYHRIYYTANGNYSFAGNPIPVIALDANCNPVGYWDVSADGLSMTPNTTQSGGYDLYDIEIQVARFVQKIPLYGTNYALKSLESDDVEYLPPGYFLRMKIWNPEIHYELVDNEYVSISGCKPCRFWGYFFSYRESTLP